MKSEIDDGFTWKCTLRKRGGQGSGAVRVLPRLRVIDTKLAVTTRAADDETKDATKQDIHGT